MSIDQKWAKTPLPPLSRQKKPVVHGAYAKSPTAMQVRSRKVGRLVRSMRVRMPYLTEQDIPCCRGWAEAELIGAALFAAIMKGGAIHTKDGDIAARRVVDDWRKIKMLQLSYERELLMTPAVRATLSPNTKPQFDLVAVLAQPVPETAEVPEPDPESGQK
jgi:hypothetical protein